MGARLAATPSHPLLDTHGARSGGPGVLESKPLPSCCQAFRFPAGSGVSLLLTAPPVFLCSLALEPESSVGARLARLCTIKAPAIVTIQSRLYMVDYILGGFSGPLAGYL